MPVGTAKTWQVGTDFRFDAGNGNLHRLVVDRSDFEPRWSVAGCRADGGVRVLPLLYALGHCCSYGGEVTSFDRLAARLRDLSPRSVGLLVVAVVAWFTGLDAWSNDPEYRQADWFTWLLLAVSLLALVWRRRWPVAVAVVTGAACAGWALYGHIGELLNLPTIVALYTVAVRGDRRRTVRTGLIASLTSGAVALWVGNDVVNPQGLAVLEWPGGGSRASRSG